MTDELRALEEEALHHSLELKKVRKKEKAIKDSIKELRDIDTIIDKHNCDKSALIQILLDIQKKYNWLPNHALLWTSERLNIPMSQILNIATFYKAFSLEEKGKHTVKVCLGTACHVRGGPEIMRRVEEKLGVKSGETTEDGMFTVESVNCLGCCALGPVMMVDDEYHGKLEPAKVEGILASYREAT
ncbi:MAG: NADH-quinone oxidoreductase subunit NuoE [Thermoplasmata archaeon]|nr:NADH-quinone oxidoreductase subunit NuoE [Thermoplasmata archaeon]